MSAVLTASRPLRRRSLERTAMTPEEELGLLIAEQQRDDTHFVNRHEGEISMDAPAPNGEGVIGDLIGIDEDGEILTFGLRPGRALADTPKRMREAEHGTIYTYRRLGCKCAPCRAAQTKAVSEYRARRKGEQQ